MKQSLNLRRPILCPECCYPYRINVDSVNGIVKMTHSTATFETQVDGGVIRCSRLSGGKVTCFEFKTTDHIKGKPEGTALLNIECPICLACGSQYEWAITPCRLRVKFTHICRRSSSSTPREQFKPLALFTIWI